MADVHRALQSIQSFCNQDNGFMHSLALKRQLLLLLLEDEKGRLDVWLYPLDHERKQTFSSAGSDKGPSDVSSLAYTSCIIRETTNLRP